MNETYVFDWTYLDGTKVILRDVSLSDLTRRIGLLSEVLAIDIINDFDSTIIFSKETSELIDKSILVSGGSRD